MRWVGKWWLDLPPGVRRREFARMVDEIRDILKGHKPDKTMLSHNRAEPREPGERKEGESK